MNPPMTALSAGGNDLREQALICLQTADPMLKVAHVAMLAHALESGRLSIDPRRELTCDTPLPGRPLRPRLVEPRDVPRRGLGTPQGRAALLHALAHIEFNAINLGLDAVWRFAGMPEAYYRDWFFIAAEEAHHFCLLKDRIEHWGYDYGSFEAHDGLWDMAEKTQHDVLARMALVPRTLEARGLDVTPAIRAKLLQSGDDESAKALDIILRDEIGHVGAGNVWYRWLCAQRGLDAVTTHDALAQQHGVLLPHPPFNREARLAAGFSAADLDRWETPT